MSDTKKIKVVYNWIGPTGPTDNNYFPNVLSFTQAFDDENKYANVWSANWTWKNFFALASENFELCPSLAVEDDTTFVFPMSLSWRAYMWSHFYTGAGIIEQSRLTEPVLSNIRYRNGYLVIDYSHDGSAVTHDDFDRMHSYFKNTKIPLNKVIHIPGAMNGKEMYDRYCSDRGISLHEDKMNVVPYYRWHDEIYNQYSSEPNYDVDVLPEKLFLSMNKRARKHRYELALLMEKNNLIDRSYVSFNKHDEDTGISFIEKCTNMGCISNFSSITPDVVNRFVSKLPLIIDGETDVMKILHANLEDKVRPFYQNSLISLVSETHFYEKPLILSEKILRPIKEKHPFIIIGGAGSFKYIREFGFKTFSEFWDESYDDCIDPVERMHRIDALVNTIGQWTPEQILDFKRKVKPIVEHNFKVFTSELQQNAVRLTLGKINDIVKKNIR